MDRPLLSVSNLNIAFQASTDTGWRSVVNDLSFTIDKGKTVALVGESGSGKSVSALSIMRLLDRKSSRLTGSIELDGVDLLKLPEHEMYRIRGNRISMIFQEPMTSLNPVYPIGMQVAEVLRRHRGMTAEEARKETIRLFERVRIPAASSRIDDYPHHFSGGMRQRVLIAMALACDPELLIADEPTTALDVTIQAQIIALIKELQDEQQMSVLFITHDMGVVAEVADDTVVMFKGDQVETGPTAEIFSEQKHPYTRALLAAVPRLGSMANIPNPRKFEIVDKVTGATTPEQDVPSSVLDAGEPLLQVKGLTKRFDIHGGNFGKVVARVHAVENVSFDVRAGETLALVGESGCGKSTTGRALVQLQRATSGSVLFNGVEISSLSNMDLRGLRRDIQMIFQDPFASLNPSMKIGDAIAEPMLFHGLANRAQARDRVTELMEVVGLNPEFAERLPHEFSGGQRQRIAIARVLAVEPKLIVADEVVSALDVSIKAKIINLMLDLQQSRKLAYIFISHDMAVVERMSHKVAIMYLGEIVEIGPRDAIFNNPQHPYTRRLLDAVPVADPSRRSLRTSPSTEEIKNPIRRADYVVPTRRYVQVAPDHLVQSTQENHLKNAS